MNFRILICTTAIASGFLCGSSLAQIREPKGVCVDPRGCDVTPATPPAQSGPSAEQLRQQNARQRLKAKEWSSDEALDYFDRKDWDNAIRSFEEALDQDPDDPDLSEWLARAKAEKKKAEAGLPARDTVPAGSNVDAGTQLKGAEHHSAAAAVEGSKHDAGKGFDTSGRESGSLVYGSEPAGRPMPAFLSNLPQCAKNERNCARNDAQIQTSVAYYQKLDALQADTERKIEAVTLEQQSGKGDAAVLAARLGTLTNDRTRQQSDLARVKTTLQKRVTDLGYDWDESPSVPASGKAKEQ